MKSQDNFQILLFYKYVFINNPEEVSSWLRALCQKFNLKGRLIVATEGLNITLEGQTDKTELFINELETDARFQNIHFKRSVGNGNSFPKLSVKVRPEIVSLNLGVCDIDPNQLTGKYLKPEELHEWIREGKEFYIVDMRNVYEHAIGRFKNSICPPMNNFRDLQKVVKKLNHLKNEVVLTVCTGGVRCEKASGYLISKGFKNVYQLQGGIVSYMEKYPNEDFEGKLYVFDGRVAMGFYTDDPSHIVIGTCKNCKSKSENVVDCRIRGCNGQFILCDFCQNKQEEKKGMTYCPDGCLNSNIFSKFFNKLKIVSR